MCIPSAHVAARDATNRTIEHRMASSLLVLVLCALPVVLFVVEPAVGCPQRVPDRVYASPSLTQGETWHRGMSLFRNTATTSKRRRRDRELSGPSPHAPRPSIHPQYMRCLQARPHTISMIRNESDCISRTRAVVRGADCARVRRHRMTQAHIRKVNVFRVTTSSGL